LLCNVGIPTESVGTIPALGTTVEFAVSEDSELASEDETNGKKEALSPKPFGYRRNLFLLMSS
jgi:hypothetical protein